MCTRLHELPPRATTQLLSVCANTSMHVPGDTRETRLLPERAQLTRRAPQHGKTCSSSTRKCSTSSASIASKKALFTIGIASSRYPSDHSREASVEKARSMFVLVHGPASSMERVGLLSMEMCRPTSDKEEPSHTVIYTKYSTLVWNDNIRLEYYYGAKKS